MKRVKRHNIKKEQPESSSYPRDHEERDLAYYIHDRVELMHQVFSILKYKDLKAMAPECVRNLPVGDLQELCTEELLGISSKRLLATLDGAEPPSDTESSSRSPSPDPMETISLDSISSDEEILSQSSKKKKHKHRRNSKTKSKKREKQKSKEADETTEVSKASRAGLTVLELLELQARARAIRAQLQNEQAKKQEEAVPADSNTDDEVEIKEEAPDVVEISSGDEKPDLSTLLLAEQKLQKTKEPQKPKETKEPQKTTEPPKTPTKSKDAPKAKEPLKTKEPQSITDNEEPEKTVTRRVSDLIITVPQAKASRKIKLNRNKVTVPNPESVDTCIVTVEKAKDPDDALKDADKLKKKLKKKKKKTLEEGSDHDEITLQLSESEKMDLLEDLNEKNYDRLSSNSDSESSSDSDEATPNITDVTETKSENKDYKAIEIVKTVQNLKDEDSNQNSVEKSPETCTESPEDKINETNQGTDNFTDKVTEKSQNISEEVTEDGQEENVNKEKVVDKNVVESTENVKNKKVLNENMVDGKDNSEPTIDANISEIDSVKENQAIIESVDDVIAEETITKDVATDTAVDDKAEELSRTENEQKIAKERNNTTMDDAPIVSDETNKQDTKAIQDLNKEKESGKQDLANATDLNKEKARDKDKSEGELSDRESSEVETVDVEPEVVCISDDETKTKKKKKKDKKSKKQKKAKKSKKDFREDGDQNFFKDATETTELKAVESVEPPFDSTIDMTDDDVYEIMELSDDSSCYEVEGTVLSKEPTAEEIEALSAKIDEIKKEDIEITPAEENQEPEHILSWKDRYLDSKKVKRVLTTANILNALRKKNKDLKRKIEEAKKQETEETVPNKVLEEGSIEHYETLPSNKSDPVPEIEKNDETEVKDEEVVTKEMKKDAKQLLKMYRKLMNSKKDKRREKKKKRKEKKRTNEADTQNTESL